MKDRFFRLRRLLTGAMSLLLIGGMMYSCSDDYDLPDKSPSWLGSSILGYLQDKGNYTNTVKLIQDLKLDTILSRTGSKTLFVADDAAYNRFYANNGWGVKSYSDLTQSQKKMLLYGSMLDNAYLLEMMSSTSSSTMNSDGKYLDKNMCLRQPTSLTATDTIAFYSWDSPAIPRTYNLGIKNPGAKEGQPKPDEDYWARFRKQEKGGIRMATDATVPLMIHWIAGQMGEQKITDQDFATIMGRERQPNDVYIFGSKVVEQDITCQNGYVNVLDNVFTTPYNMAEQIRISGKTNLFSHMLDRFSAPYYNASLTRAYQQLVPGVDSVFEKRYLSARSQGGTELSKAPNNHGGMGADVGFSVLPYDPGWNTYYSTGHGVQVDMAAMFIPSDEALYKYFLDEDGGGRFLMDAFATEKPVTKDNLMRNLDQIPLSIIQPMVKNFMKPSFIESVPSKYISIMNDARDPMFSNCETVEDFTAKIDTCLIGCNGVVYIMNDVYSPADYACVAAPALVGDSFHIFNWAIRIDNESKYIQDPNLDTDKRPCQYMQTYLQAMSSNFGLFLPTDRALRKYFDPLSATVFEFEFDGSLSTINQVSAIGYDYDPVTGEISTEPQDKGRKKDKKTVANRLKDMLNDHVYVDPTDEKTGIYTGNEFFISKSGAPFRVIKPETGIGFKVQGAYQIEKNDYCTVQDIYDQSEKTNGYGNGMTYALDKPIQSTNKSVYTIMNDDGDEESPYRQFMDLCLVDLDVLRTAGFVDDLIAQKKSENEITKALGKYAIFTSDNYPIDQNVRFFNTYRYTVYIPTNASVQEAITKNGLPTWNTISAYLTERQEYLAENEAYLSDEEITAITEEYKTKAQAMITCLLNFVKYHFQDNSVFADLKPQPAQDYESACIDTVTNRYITLKVWSEGNHTLTVQDKAGDVRNVITADGHYNMMTRDIQQDRKKTLIETSSYAVLHQIDGVLNFKPLEKGRYDSEWSTTAKAKKFVSRYRLTNK